MSMDKEEFKEKLKNIVSIIGLLESDMQQQKAEDIHIRAVSVVHELLHEAIKECV